eukprot:Sspe_Gene.116030::Locus_104297_Transcript_1_1_Confidence_1.000_Length_302::g.116030::m.116030
MIPPPYWSHFPHVGGGRREGEGGGGEGRMCRGGSNAPDGELRVLFVTASYHIPDGVSTTIRRITRHLKGAGVQYAVVTSDVPREGDADHPVITVPSVSLP